MATDKLFIHLSNYNVVEITIIQMDLLHIHLMMTIVWTRLV
jgi:hypothetical protein